MGRSPVEKSSIIGSDLQAAQLDRLDSRSPFVGWSQALQQCRCLREQGMNLPRARSGLLDFLLIHHLLTRSWRALLCHLPLHLLGAYPLFRFLFEGLHLLLGVGLRLDCRALLFGVLRR